MLGLVHLSCYVMKEALVLRNEYISCICWLYPEKFPFFIIVGFLQPKIFAIWSIKSHHKSAAWMVLHSIGEI